MRRYFFGFILTLTLLFALVIGLIRAQPAPGSPLETFLDPPPGCRVPCFLGVRPYQTTIEQALAILRANDQVKQVQVETTYDGQLIYWRWRDDPSTFRRYAFRVVDNIVTDPIIPATTTLGDLQLALGEPEVVVAAYTNESMRRVALIFEYPSRGLHVIVTGIYLCQVDQEAFWQLHYQSGMYGSFYVEPGEVSFARMLPGSQQTLDRDSWAKQARDYCQAGHS